MNQSEFETKPNEKQIWSNTQIGGNNVRKAKQVHAITCKTIMRQIQFRFEVEIYLAWLFEIAQLLLSEPCFW